MALLSHGITVSPDAGLNFSATVVVGAAATVEVVTTAGAAVVSVDAVELLHPTTPTINTNDKNLFMVPILPCLSGNQRHKRVMIVEESGGTKSVATGVDRLFFHRLRWASKNTNIRVDSGLPIKLGLLRVIDKNSH